MGLDITAWDEAVADVVAYDGPVEPYFNAVAYDEASANVTAWDSIA